MKKYDIFISSKSEDYSLAEGVCDFLKANGLKVFIASRELQKIGEAQYAKAIDEVLDNSAHMIVVASSLENIKSKWVEYEWSLFSNDLKSGYREGNLITILSDAIELKTLPGSLRHQQSFNLNSYKDYILDYLRVESNQETINFSNGDKYIGQTKDGKPHGQGIMYYIGGDKYEGEWNSGMRHGQGIMYYASGDIFKCWYDNDKYVKRIIEQNFLEKIRCYLKNHRRGCIYSLACLVVLLTSISIYYWINYNPNSSSHPIPENCDYITIDLGLPSRTLWCNKNIGAKKTSDFGNLYAWKDDIATQELGNCWSIPSEVQFKELIDECEWRWITDNNNNGFLIVGKNGNSIFLPAGGWEKDSIEHRDKYGYYWSSTLSANKQYARQLLFSKEGKGYVGNGELHVGRSVRPIYHNITK